MEKLKKIVEAWRGPHALVSLLWLADSFFFSLSLGMSNNTCFRRKKEELMMFVWNHFHYQQPTVIEGDKEWSWGEKNKNEGILIKLNGNKSYPNMKYLFFFSALIVFCFTSICSKKIECCTHIIALSEKPSFFLFVCYVLYPWEFFIISKADKKILLLSWNFKVLMIIFEYKQ